MAFPSSTPPKPRATKPLKRLRSSASRRLENEPWTTSQTFSVSPLTSLSDGQFELIIPDARGMWIEGQPEKTNFVYACPLCTPAFDGEGKVTHLFIGFRTCLKPAFCRLLPPPGGENKCVPLTLPSLAFFACVLQACEQPGVEHLVSIGSVEAFDKRGV